MAASIDGDHESLFRSIEESGRGAQLFGQLVVELLGAHAAAQARQLVVPGATEDLFAARLPDGLDDTRGPMAVIVNHSGGRPASARLPELLERSLFVARQKKIATLLLVHDGQISSQDEVELRRGLSKGLATPTVLFWGRRQLDPLLERYPSVVHRILEQGSTRQHRHAPQPESEEIEERWCAARRTRLEELQDIYANANLTLFLGAGISRDAGLPDWNSLIDHLSGLLVMNQLSDVEASQEEMASLAKRVRRLSGDSPLISARYLRKGLAKGASGDSDDRLFGEDVTAMLYHGSSTSEHGRALLEAVADACQPVRTGAKIRAVVTFNFDDLLEQELQDRNIHHRAIFREGDSADPLELPIYHVHGFLPRCRDSYEGLENTELAFSEEAYHRMFADPFHWSNLVQLNHLREGPCLMLGLSLMDPNLRRLLEVATRGWRHPRHYAFLQRLPLTRFIKEGQADDPSLRQQTAVAFLAKHHDLQEAVFEELRVKVIWFEDFVELPDYLRTITQRAVRPSSAGEAPTSQRMDLGQWT